MMNIKVIEILDVKSFIEFLIDISIGTKQTLQQDEKINNVTQDDEQRNVALRGQNHKKTR